MLNPISVSDLTSQVARALEGAEFRDLAVEGEVSNFVHHSSGHMYFSLKDERSRIKAVMFRGKNRRLDFLPQNGDTLIALGSLGVYEPNGEYQLYVDMLFPRGVGDLHLSFQKLKEQLEKEGLFASERKLPLPFLPKRIGIITSPTGAAIRDILQILQRRFPGIRVLIIPALVQGETAPESLLQALARAERTDLDVVIIGRGGGSFEELAAFNDEALARAIAASPLPIISAVGHETDFTIADLVADLRAPTPSAAAELVIPPKEDLQLRITSLCQRLTSTMKRRIDSERRYLRRLGDSAALRKPQQAVAMRRQRVDELWTSIHQLQSHRLKLKRATLSKSVGKLETLSPLNTLSRGYAICQDEEGQVIRKANQTKLGSLVNVTLHEGRLVCRVEGGE